MYIKHQPIFSLFHFFHFPFFHFSIFPFSHFSIFFIFSFSHFLTFSFFQTFSKNLLIYTITLVSHTSAVRSTNGPRALGVSVKKSVAPECGRRRSSRSSASAVPLTIRRQRRGRPNALASQFGREPLGASCGGSTRARSLASPGLYLDAFSRRILVVIEAVQPLHISRHTTDSQNGVSRTALTYDL